MHKLARLVGLAVLLSSPLAHAQHVHGESAEAPKPKASEPASTRAYKADMDKMHGEMDIKYTGNADLDFVNGMIPHHEGAIAMAETQLKYGKDERLRRMAKSIIAAQAKEVRFMRDWRDNKLPAPYKAPSETAKE